MDNANVTVVVDGKSVTVKGAVAEVIRRMIEAASVVNSPEWRGSLKFDFKSGELVSYIDAMKA